MLLAIFFSSVQLHGSSIGPLRCDEVCRISGERGLDVTVADHWIGEWGSPMKMVLQLVQGDRTQALVLDVEPPDCEAQHALISAGVLVGLRLAGSALVAHRRKRDTGLSIALLSAEDATTAIRCDLEPWPTDIAPVQEIDARRAAALIADDG